MRAWITRPYHDLVDDMPGPAPVRRPVPLRRRRVDWVLLAFFAVNLCFITYFIDIEQLTVANAAHFHYPAWPPPAIVNLVHSYGRHYDPLLMARPAFWRMTIWIDVLWNGPFYVAAIYAIARGREWIRVPALVWSGSMSAVVLVILAEEHSGVHRSPHFWFVLLLNLPWLALPAATIVRMARNHPFTELVTPPMPAPGPAGAADPGAIGPAGTAGRAGTVEPAATADPAGA
jgi:EXPERA (EXPanded EBP superfamily)